jgi:iron(III) transport system substrate-binding protein
LRHKDPEYRNDRTGELTGVFARRRRVVGGLAGAAAAIGAGLAHRDAHAQDDPEWARVIAAAKKEGKLVLYTSGVGSPFHKEVGALFEKKYGIRFESLEARASELRERIRTEQAAGRFMGDVHHNGGTTTALMLADGNFQPHGGIPNARRLAEPYKADDVRVPSNVQSYGILVNRNLVKPQDRPKSWKDLLDPRWKGKILSDDLRALGGGSVFFFVMHDAFGPDFHEKLAAQELVFSRDIRNDERRIARGEYPIYIPQLLPYYPGLKGLPVDFIVPEEGRPYVRFDVTMLKNAPHPNAARLFMNHFLEMESQLVFANAGFDPTVQGVIDKSDASIRDLLKTKVMGTTVVERQNQMLELAKRIYK